MKDRAKRVKNFIKDGGVTYLNASSKKYIVPRIYEVLMRVPDDVFRKIERKCIFIILDREATAFHMDFPSRNHLIVLNSSRLFIGSKKDINWTIAHETAHFARFYKRATPTTNAEEVRVDKLVERWGFEKSAIHRINEKIEFFCSRLKKRYNRLLKRKRLIKNKDSKE